MVWGVGKERNKEVPRVLQSFIHMNFIYGALLKVLLPQCLIMATFWVVNRVFFGHWF